MKKQIFFIVFLLYGSIAISQPGTLDPGFGNAGITITPLGNGSGSGYSDMVVQPDGKPICVGLQNNNGTFEIGMVRYKSDGTPDSSFGINGIAYSTLLLEDVRIGSIILQPDQKILVSGTWDSDTNFDDIIVARYKNDGFLDSSFGTNGIVTTILGAFPDNGRGMALQPDGKIIVAGDMFVGDHSLFVAVRYNSNGTVDSSFDSDGIVTVDVATSHSICYTVTLQADGKILLGGRSNDIDSANELTIVRLQTTGSRDSSFGTNGIVLLSYIGFSQIVTHLLVQADGRIIAYATYSTPGTPGISRILVFRMQVNGSLDNSFGTAPPYTVIQPGNSIDASAKMALQSEGKIILAGFTTSPAGYSQFLLVRLHPNGTFDNSFDTDGIVSTTIRPNAFDEARSIALYGNRIYVAGLSYIISQPLVGVIAAYQNDGLPVPLHLLQFEAMRKDPAVELHWQTSNEEQMESYVIQRSNDGVNFIDLAKVPAFNNLGSQAYIYTDQMAPRAAIFYRLKMIGIDSLFTYSPVEKVPGLNSSKIHLYPNPVNDVLRVTLTVDDPVSRLLITDVSGKRIRDIQKPAVNSSVYTIDTKQLSAGIYYVLIHTSRAMMKEKFIKL